MERATQKSIKLLVLGIISLCITSCGDDFALTTKRYTLLAESKQWLMADTLAGKPFDMVDNNGITHNFTTTATNKYYDTGTSGFLFVPTRKTEKETMYQYSSSNYGTYLSVTVSAGIKNFGDRLRLTLGDLTLFYNIKYQDIEMLFFHSNSLQRVQTDDGFVDGDKTCNSTVETLSSIDIKNKSYQNVLHFTLKDFQDSAQKFDIVEFYYAQNVGLVKYKLQSGITVERK